MNDVIPDSAVIVSTGVLSVKSISVYDLQGRNIIGQQVGVMENEGLTVWLSFFIYFHLFNINISTKMSKF